MSDQRDGGIAWTEHTWNPIRGCTRISEGCRNCYAESVAARFSGPGLAYEGLARMGANGPRWTGRLRMVDDHLDDPIRWTRPRMVFVNSMSDLFHEALSNDQIDQVWVRMLLSPHHTFQVLTKRAARARRYLTDPELYRRLLRVANDLRCERPKLGQVGISDPTRVPAPWIWLGVSVEDQDAADARVPDLCDTPAGVRFLSVEPQLGPVDLLRVQWPGRWPVDVLRGGAWNFGGIRGFTQHSDMGKIGWVIVGGESGANARPFDIAWAREIVAQCREANVPVFVKQLGARPVDGEWRSGVYASEDRRAITAQEELGRGTPPNLLLLRSRKGDDMSEWPEDLRVRQFPKART